MSRNPWEQNGDGMLYSMIAGDLAKMLKRLDERYEDLVCGG